MMAEVQLGLKYLIMLIRRKLVEQVQSVIKLWVLQLTINRLYQTDSTLTKISIGNKLFREVQR